MPGVVGILRLDGQAATISPALLKLQHFPHYQSKEVYRMERAALGIVDCQDRAPAFDWHFDAEARAGALISGAMLAAHPMPHVLRAAEVLREYQKHGFARWHQFEGGFVAVIVDLARDRLFIANDRLGQLPLYYASHPDMFAFAPEVKGILVHDGFSARLSPAGAINFLSAGYCFGDLTLFEGVNALEPSTLLAVNLSTLALEKTRLWKMVYAPARELHRRRAAEDALFQSILEAHKTILCGTPSRAALLLSAGLDSRGMLAALDHIGQRPQLALTWGLPDNIPYSDATLARRLADAFGVPFVFIPYTSDTFVENAARWCYLSELATDNFGWCAQGPEVLAPLTQESCDVLLVGDEVWGRGGYVMDEEEARAAIFPPRLPPGLRQILREPIVKDAEEMYNDAVRRISQSCENDDFVDRKDFMYIHGRVARFLFPIRSQYRKELALLLRRPFLSNTILEVVRQLPSHYRLDRNLYISMLRRHFSRAMNVPISKARSNPDWIFETRCEGMLRTYLLKLLDFKGLAQTPLEQFLDQPRFEQMRDAFFEEDPRQLSQQSSWLMRWKTQMAFFASHFPRAVSHLPKTARIVRSMGRSAKPGAASTNDRFTILRRIALLSLLQEQLNNFEHL